MPTQWQIESLQSRLHSLTLEINRVRDKDHPYRDPDTVFEALKGVIASRVCTLEDAIAEYPLGNKDNERKLQEILIAIADSAEEISELFSSAERVDSARIPFEILRSLSWIASSLLNEECHAVVRLDSEYNYNIVSCSREFKSKEWDHEWSKAVAETRSQQKQLANQDKLFERAHERPYTVLLLGFPSYDASSTLLHALAAHEFGHEIFFRYEEQIAQILDRALARAIHKDHHLHTEIEECAARNRTASGVGAGDEFAKNVDQVKATLLEFLDDWIVEIFSDLFAANLLGPSFIAAFDKLELRPFRVDKKHPPGRFRRRIVEGYLKQYLPHIVRDPVWEKLLDTDKEFGPSSNIPEHDDPLAPLYGIGEEICKLCLKDLSELIKPTHSTPSPLADEETLKRIITETESHLLNLSPPSVPLALTGTDSDVSYFWLLIYAVWHFRFNTTKFEEFVNDYAGGDTFHAEEIIGSLLLTALESIEIRFLWYRDSLERMAH